LSLQVDQPQERRWVLVEGAAAESGVPVTSIKSWAKSNLLEARVERVQRRSRMLVDLDEVLLARAIAAENDGARPRSTEERWLGLTLKLSSLLVSAQSRALEAESALQRERRRVLGLLLALASSRRERRRLPLLVRARMLSLLVYVVATLVFAFLLLTGRS
jgi:hypothetical protein